MQSRSLMQLRKQITEDQVTGESLLVPCDRQLEIGDFVINDETVSCWCYDAEKHHNTSCPWTSSRPTGAPTTSGGR